MSRINFSDQLSLAIEPEGKRLRLIIFNGDYELLCHKADQSELKQFVLAERSHLFKGRLQLDQIGDHISINVKGKTAGAIGLAEFEKLFN